MKKLSIFVVFILIVSLLMGCTSQVKPGDTDTKSEQGQNTEPDSGSQSETTDSTPAESDKTDTVDTADTGKQENAFTDDDFEVTEYSYNSGWGGIYYFLVVKNNSDTAVKVTASGTLKDSDGNTIDDDDTAIDVLGPGEESIGYFYFYGDSESSSVDYEIDYSAAFFRKPVLSSLEVEKTFNDRNIILSTTNTGDDNAEYVQAHALFLDGDGKVIEYENTYVTDGDSEIKSGKTTYTQLNFSEENYDNVLIYFTGYSSGDGSASSEPVSADLFEVEEYIYEDDWETVCYLVITNNSEKNVTVFANGVAKDGDGKLIGAGNMQIAVIGPGEQSIGDITFRDVVDNIETIEYDISYSEQKYYSSALSDLSLEVSENEHNAVISVTNNGTKNATVDAFALFLDENGKVIYAEIEDISGSFDRIEPGRTISKQVDCYDSYDSVLVYLTAYADDYIGDPVEYVSPESFDIDEYMYVDIWDDTNYYLIITNNSDKAVTIYASGVAKNADGKALGADMIGISVLGPGEQTIGCFSFGEIEGFDSAEYEIDFISSDLDYDPVLSNLAVEQTVNEDNISISVTNNGDYPAEYVDACTLFFDENGNVIDYVRTNVYDDDYEIKAGETVTAQIEFDCDYDSFKIYFTGEHSNW